VVKLPSRRHVILSDTVGFISELPTQLVAAFRATLEEVLEADVILHVRDIADPESDLQNSDVRKVLAELGITAEDSRLIEVLNKVDLLDVEERDRIAQQAVRADASVVVSALTGEGEGDLLAAIDRRISRSEEVVRFAVDASNGAAIAWLYENGNVLDRRDEGETANIAVGLEPADRARFERRFADALH
jgi:GTP-binding protein HflX